jgi:hypothetical protein
MRLKNKIISVALAMMITVVPTACLAAGYSMDSYITSAKTPVSSSEAQLAWSKQFGTTYRDSPSVQTVVGDTVIVMSRKTLYKLDSETGKVIASAEMVDSPSYGYTPVTYANGVLYCPLGNGRIQAFNYKTMKSLWVYKDAIGGQSLTPITYDNGYIYTGFWKDEDAYANYVCISVKDENKSETNEEKSATWVYKSLGGFYWAGCAVQGDYVVFGTDNGTREDNDNAKAVCLNKTSGKAVDTLTVTGDQRTSMTVYNGKLYFATKAGWLYSVSLNSSGTFNESSLEKLNLYGASTSAPVVYNGRLYIGVQGEGFSTGYIKVINASNLKLIYSADIKGYPQNAVLVSDAYYKKTGKVYIYTTYNAYPGGITVLTDSDGQTSAVTQELFTPESSKTNYCISSIVVDENGTLFYKNDSGYVFAIKNSSNKVSWFAKIFKAIINFFKNLFN